MHKPNTLKRAFTLIELSIVLVIIGLIVGGVLVGRDLVRAAEVRAQMAQIQEIKASVNTFRDRYGSLPGDIRDPDATRFGFVARSSVVGDGNGTLDGLTAANVRSNHSGASGESTLLWRDLSRSKLIAGDFSSATSAAPSTAITLTQLPKYLPLAKLNSDSFIISQSLNGVNYLALTKLSGTIGVSGWVPPSGPVLSPSAAFTIDQKMDDGTPGQGSVLGAFQIMGSGFIWPDQPTSDTLSTSATAASETSCYDNANVTGAEQRYSVRFQNGLNVTCGLIFKAGY